jgi:hypothetical protein
VERAEGVLGCRQSVFTSRSIPGSSINLSRERDGQPRCGVSALLARRMLLLLEHRGLQGECSAVCRGDGVVEIAMSIVCSQFVEKDGNREKSQP